MKKKHLAILNGIFGCVTGPFNFVTILALWIIASDASTKPFLVWFGIGWALVKLVFLIVALIGLVYYWSDRRIHKAILILLPVGIVLSFLPWADLSSLGSTVSLVAGILYLVALKGFAKNQ